MKFFNFLRGRNKNKKATIPNLGIFELIIENEETRIEGAYNSKSFGKVMLSFPTQNNQVSKHQLKILDWIESRWEVFKTNINAYEGIVSIMIPDYKDHTYDEIDVEIVYRDEGGLNSMILKNNKVLEIIKIE